jgi:hypothetical protein
MGDGLDKLSRAENVFVYFKKDFELLGGGGGGYFCHTRTLNIIIRCYDYRWPVLILPPYFLLWGWYYWTEKVKARGRGIEKLA